MDRQECKKYDQCSAPLCPLDSSSLENGIWYPDEEICLSRKHSGLLWVKNQKKITKKAKTQDKYFNLKMLDRPFVIRQGIEGLDPDQPEHLQLTRWLKQHPPMSTVQRKRRAEWGKKLAAQTQGL